MILGTIPGCPACADRVPLDDLLAKVDALTLHCPLNEYSRDFICAHELAGLKPRGAATDVLSVEPPANGKPSLIGTPQSAWSSREARQRIVGRSIKNAQGFFSIAPFRGVDHGSAE